MSRLMILAASTMMLVGCGATSNHTAKAPSSREAQGNARSRDSLQSRMALARLAAEAERLREQTEVMSGELDLLRAAAQQADTPAVIETQIEGEFEGWDGETVFRLANGQIWQQAAYDYRYHYAFRPDVLIYKSRSGWKMQVAGVDDTLLVSRIR